MTCADRGVYEVLLSLNMSKIRINELARQLEVPSHTILELLPELGVTEKKTHSSSIDDNVAELIRKRYSGNGAVSTATAPAYEAEPEVSEPETEEAAPAAPVAHRAPVEPDVEPVHERPAPVAAAPAEAA